MEWLFGGGAVAGFSTETPDQQDGPSFGGCLFKGVGGCIQTYRGNVFNSTVGVGFGEGLIINTNLGWHETSVHNFWLPY
jgi:hypothetical protein